MRMTDKFIFKTKLYPQKLRPNLIRRPKLIQKLDEAINLGRKITVVSASAGYGKSTLIAEWLSGRGCPYAWLSLDENDNDPVRFLNYIIATVQVVFPDAMVDAEDLLGSPNLPPPASLAAILANDILPIVGEFVLVLDDYHVISNSFIHETIQYFIDYQPQNLHIVLITRHDPPLPLPRWRVRGQVTEVRIDDLRFGTDETAEFFKTTMELNLSNNYITAIEERTEGWAAGLQLAGLSMAGLDGERVESFVEDFSGSSRFCMDYLFEEVLQRLDIETQEFLCSTSMLDTLTPQLCDAVTGLNDSRKILEQLEKSNLFLIPLDDRHEWYRYHHLFADFLMTELENDKKENLHRLAGLWLEENNLTEKAIKHYTMARDMEHAADLIIKSAEDMFKRCELATLQGLIEALPGEWLSAKGILSVYRAWCLFLTGHDEQAKSIVYSLERSDEVLKNSLDRGMMLALKSLFYMGHKKEDPISIAEEAVSLIGESSLFFLATALLSLGQAHAAAGNTSKAARYFKEAYEYGKKIGNHLIITTSLANLAINLVWLGRRRDAVDLCLGAIEEYTDKRGRVLQTAQIVYLILGMLYYMSSDLSLACDYLKKGISYCRKFSLAHMMGVGEFTIVFAQYGLGDIEGAFATINETRKLAMKVNNKGMVLIMDTVEAELNLRQGNYEAAFRWADNAGFKSSESHSSNKILMHLTYVRILLAQKKTGEAEIFLKNMEKSCLEGDRMGHLVSIYILQAIVRDAGGLGDDAARYLEKALSIAYPEGIIQPFIDEALALSGLLPKVCYIAPALVDRVMGALETRNQNSEPIESKNKLKLGDGIAELLSDREIEIMWLIAEGLSNDDIARKLYITLGTAKWHINNIYGKLGVNKRTQAVEKARKLGIIK